MTTPAWEALERELDSVDAGDAEGLVRARTLVPSCTTGPERQAWTWAIDASAWFSRAEGRRPSPHDFNQQGLDPHGDSRGALRAAGRVCMVMERAAIVELDPTALRGWIAAHEALGQRDAEAISATALRAAQGWLEILLGRAPIDLADDLHRDAARAGDRRHVTQATAMRAIAQLATGNIPRALLLARRAALMARTEALAEDELLTATWLARVRRRAKRPDAALKILGTLAGATTWRGRGWLAWELLLAGGAQARVRTTDDTGEPGLVGEAAGELERLLSSAERGDRGSFAEAAHRLLERTDACPLLRAEAEIVVAALDGERPAPPAVESWRRGDTPDVPPELHGLALRAAGLAAGPSGSASWVVAQPEEAGKRVLLLGVPLFVQASRRSVERPEPDQAGQSRGLAAAATLVLAGPEGLDTVELFQRVYGFPFVRDLHDGTFRVLLHRVRALLSATGEVQRQGERLCLRLASPVALPDPRCAQPLETQLILHLAAAGGASTEAAAQHLGVAERTTRELMRQLVSAGVCRARREGRQITYEVDETIITQLTALGPRTSGRR